MRSAAEIIAAAAETARAGRTRSHLLAAAELDALAARLDARREAGRLRAARYRARKRGESEPSTPRVRRGGAWSATRAQDEEGRDIRVTLRRAR
jgi:hypothetical protein